MVFPLIVPIVLGGAVFSSAYALEKLRSKNRCEREFEGSCNKECDYFTGDAETCYTCLGTCGVPPEDYAYYLNMLNPYEQYQEQPHEYVAGYPVDHDYNYEDRDDHEKYRTGRRNKDKWEDRDRDRGRGRGGKKRDRSLLQDRLDRMSGKHTREHIGGGRADMTQDNRGYYGIIIS